MDLTEAGHILIKLMKIKHKEQMLKAAREKQQITLGFVGSACSISAMVTLGLPPLTVCVLSQSMLLRLKVALPGTF